MKKYIALILAISALTLASCSSGDSDSVETDEQNVESVEEVETEPEVEESKPSIPVPEEVEIIEFEILSLAKDPVYEDGTLVLYFNENDVWYDENTVANIGVVADDEAYTVKAEIDFDSYPDMTIDERNHCGIALKPVFDIDPGEYRFSVSFDEYKVEFNFAV